MNAGSVPGYNSQTGNITNPLRGDMKYVHQPLDTEIRSIGGYYKVMEEGHLDFEGRKVLYVLKGAHVDNSCCGAGGLGFVSVPGYLVRWKSSTSEDGLPVSEVERVRSSADRKKLKALIKKKYPYIEVIDFD